MKKLLKIKQLVRLAEDYRLSRVVESVNVDGRVICLVKGADNKLKISCSSNNQMGPDCCPYCKEAIPFKTLGEIEDWVIVGNKFASTNFEVSAVSKWHNPHVNISDFGTWLRISEATESCVIYSPLRKSLPFHKHVQLLDFSSELLSNLERNVIFEGISLVRDEERAALVISGNFEFKLKTLTRILMRLYSYGHAYNLAITPRDIYVMPSKSGKKMLGNRVFIGLVSTEDRMFFNYIKQRPLERDDLYYLPDFTAYNYTDLELKRLAAPEHDCVSLNIHSLRNRLSVAKIYPKGVLFWERDLECFAKKVSEYLDCNLAMHEHFFVTDKKGIFLANKIESVLPRTKGSDLLVVSSSFNESIFDSMINFAERSLVSRLFVLGLNDRGRYELKTARTSSGWDEFNSFPGLLL